MIVTIGSDHGYKTKEAIKTFDTTRVAKMLDVLKNTVAIIQTMANVHVTW